MSRGATRDQVDAVVAGLPTFIFGEEDPARPGEILEDPSAPDGTVEVFRHSHLTPGLCGAWVGAADDLLLSAVEAVGGVAALLALAREASNQWAGHRHRAALEALAAWALARGA